MEVGQAGPLPTALQSPPLHQAPPPSPPHHPSPTFAQGPLLPGRMVQTGSGELPPIHPARIVVSGPALGHSNSFDRRLQHQVIAIARFDHQGSK